MGKKQADVMGGGGDQRADDEALDKLLVDDLGQKHYVDARIAAQSRRQRRRARKRMFMQGLIWGTLGIAFIWVIIITALGATIGLAFSKPDGTSQFCRQLTYEWVMSLSECTDLVALPEQANTTTVQLTRDCVGRDASNNSQATKMDETVVMTGASKLWSWQTHTFEDGPYIGTILSMSGTYNNGSVSSGLSGLGVTGGVGMLGNNFAGSCAVEKSSSSEFTYTMALSVC